MRNADQGDPKKTAFLIESLQRVWGEYHCPPMEQMSFYVKINECLRQRAIPCVVVIPPMHEAVARVIQGGSAAAEVAAWKRQLGAIFPHVIDLSFSSYSTATNFYRSDPVHFKPEVGIRFMNQKWCLLPPKCCARPPLHPLTSNASLMRLRSPSVG